MMNDLTCVVLAIIAIAVTLSIPRRFVTRAHRTTGMTRAEAEKWLRESGHLGATREVIQAERETHNKNAASIAFWAGSETYIDAEGNPRRVEDYR